MDILSRFEATARQTPDKTAFVEHSGQCSYRELATRSRDCAAFLNDLGITRGDRCLVAEENSINTATCLLAIWYCGAIPVLLNTQSTPEHARHAIAMTGSRLIVTSSDAMVELDTGIPLCFSSDSLVASSKQHATKPTLPARLPESANMIASIVFTSGSSGGPKGVTQTHKSLIAGCNAVSLCLQYRPDDTILCPVPWSFDYGFGQLLTTLLGGIQQIIPQANNPFAVCESLQENKPSVFAGVPSLFAGLCQGLSPVATTDTSCLRLLTSTGSRLHSSTATALREAFPAASVSLNYGLTETYRSTSLPVDAFDTHAASVGLPLPGVTITILRDDSTVADTGEIGEVVHGGNGVFSGYWGDPERTARIRRADPLWILDGIQAPAAVFTGDLGWKDENGYLYIKGRRDRQIKTMGVLTNPDEIESILLDQGQLADVAVLSRPHETLGELIIAVYVVKPQSAVAQKDIKAFCRARMTPYMMPREFHCVESIPKTTTAKTDYSGLRRSFSAST